MRLALKSASFHLRNLRTRLPFRYGVVTLTHFPLLHLAVEVEAADGRRGRGFAADNLPPKWFDKDPTKTFRDNVEDQLASIGTAHTAYLEAARTPRPVFDIWLEAYPACRRQGRALGLNSLTASFGSSLFERALADAAGRLAGLDVVGMLRDNLLGLRHCSPRERRDATRLHPDLYVGDETQAFLRIERGALAVASLAAPGYGIAFDPDLSSMTPLAEWTFESLEAA